MNKIASILFLAFLSSCASTSQIAKFTSSNNSIPNQTARIYMVRPSFWGSAVKMKVYCNDEFIGSTGPKGYLCWDVKEGDVNIMSNTENKAQLKLHVKAGSTYYIKQTPKMGILISRVALKEITEAEGTSLVSKLKKPIEKKK